MRKHCAVRMYRDIEGRQWQQKSHSIHPSVANIWNFIPTTFHMWMFADIKQAVKFVLPCLYTVMACCGQFYLFVTILCVEERTFLRRRCRCMRERRVRRRSGSIRGHAQSAHSCLWVYWAYWCRDGSWLAARWWSGHHSIMGSYCQPVWCGDQRNAADTKWWVCC